MIKIVEMKCADLVPYKNNARINDGAVDAVAKSIKEFGFKNPIIIDRDNTVIAGHTRLKALVRLGIERAPCVIADDLTEEQIKAFRIADNSTAQIAEWDLGKLEAELTEIGLDMSGYGLENEISEIEKLVTGDDMDENVPEVDVESDTLCKCGDVWQLGKHRLVCGDSTSADDVDKLVRGERVDLCLTDPPYNVDYHGDKDGKMTIMNDNMSDSDFHIFLQGFYSQMLRVLRPGGAYYIFHADSEGLNFRSALVAAGGQVRQTLIWVKNSLVLGRQDYQWKHEPCLYGWKEGAGHYFAKDRTQTTVIENKPVFAAMTRDELEAYAERMHSELTTIIYEDKPRRNDSHPTMKPVPLLVRLIKNSTKKGEAVIDFFGGSGSTLVACEQLGRTCYTMELDPKYCDVIIKRWETLTGEKAVRV